MDSIFSIYSTNENQVTSALTAVLRNSERIVLDKFIETFVSEDFSTIQIINQSRKEENCPDAELNSNFQILIESKVGAKFDYKQIERHIASFGKNYNQKIMLVITKEQLKQDALHNLNKIRSKVLVKNLLWSEIYEFFVEVSDDVKTYNEKTRFLSNQFNIFMQEKKLDNSWKKKCVVITGEIANLEAEKFGLCLWSPEKIQQQCDYIAFYHNKKIERAFKIITSFIITINEQIPSKEELKRKAIVRTGELKETEIHKAMVGLNKSNIHKWKIKERNLLIFFFDKDKNILKNIIEHKEPNAYTQRPSYVWFDSLKNAKNTKEIKRSEIILHKD